MPPSPSQITFKPYLEEMEAAREWGCTPSQWVQEPRWSRATMVATRRTRNAIDYWIGEDAQKEVKDASS